MDPRKKKRLKAKMRVTALITAAYHESAQKSKPSSCWRYCGWPLFGYAACIVMLCLGVTVIILGGVFTKIDLFILGVVFIVGSLVLLIIVCAPGENCGRKRRVCGESSADLKDDVNEIEQHTPRPVRKPLQYTGKRTSFLRSVLGNAVQHETASRRMSSDTQTTDRSWVKVVESQQAKYRKTKATIEEEPKKLSECQNDAKQDTNNYSSVHFQNNGNDDIKIAHETINALGTVTELQSDSKDELKETTHVLRDREDEELTPARSNHRLSRDVTVQSPLTLQIHSVSITSDVNKTTSSSQITEVSIHTDPHIHLPNIDVNDHNSKEMDVDGAKLDDTKEVLVHSEETMDLERGHRKKRRKKKKRKKIELELKEESDLNHNTPDVTDKLDSTVNDNDGRTQSARLAFDHSVSRDTLQRLDTDLL